MDLRGIVGLAWIAGCAGGGDAGPVDGPADTHCDGVEPVVVDPAACDPASAPPATGTGEDDDDDEYGEPMYGSEGDDDECKYHVSFTNGDVARDADVHFDLTLTALADGTPETGASPRVEAFLDETHPAPAPGTATEGDAGAYAIDGVQFDEAGRWTVRFHFHEDCVDGETSPHGHAAFWFDVP